MHRYLFGDVLTKRTHRLIRTATCMLMLGFAVSCIASPTFPQMRVPCTVTYNPQCLKVQASALASTGDKLLIGAKDGTISVYDVTKHSGYTIAAKELPGTPSVIYKSETQIWWVTQNPPSIVSFKEPERELSIYDLSQSGLPNIKELTFWRGLLILFPESGIIFLDPTTGELFPAEYVFTPEISQDLSMSSVRFTQFEGRTLIVSSRPNEELYDTTVRSITSDEIIELGRSSLSGPVTYAVSSADGCLLLTRRSLVKLKVESTHVSFEEINIADVLPGWRVINSQGISGGIMWWTSESYLFRMDIKSGQQEAYLPWNEPGLSARQSVSIGGEAWVATDTDVRRVSINKRDKNQGFSGFVLAKLGDDECKPTDPKLAKMSQLISNWQGTPYKWGGASRTGTDCSGFVMAIYDALGKKLPHGSKPLATYNGGPIVRDEIKYGDVMVMTGHAALYVGNAQTAETMPKQGVGYGSIWQYRPVCVRRFLDSKVQANTSVPTKLKPYELTFKDTVKLIRLKSIPSLEAALAIQPTLSTKKEADGTTLLHWAADTNSTAAAKVIIDSGGKINARNKKGITPLHIAASLGNTEVANLLIHSGASVSAKDNHGRTPLDLAILYNNLRTAATIAAPLYKK